MPIKGKTVLITGGASGIGAATAELFAANGACVIVADVGEEYGRDLVARLGSEHRFVRLDVASKDAWDEAMPAIAPDGRLDVALFNAGVMTRPFGEPVYNDPLPWITPRSMDRLIGVNIYGTLWGLLACLPAVQAAGGTMLITSSAGGLQPVPVDPTYSMTKYALVGLGASLAPTLATRGVRLITICPHSVDTPMQPPDMQARKQADGYSSPPSHMAASTLHIYENGKSGEIWQSRADGLPFAMPAPTPFKAA